eukprot:4274087-Ditylum_brightwellii.AAC.1
MEEMSTMTERSLSSGRAATLIQGLVRKINARQRMIDVARRVIEPVYDKEYERHYYYNHNTKKSSWTKPSILARVSLIQTAGRWSDIKKIDGKRKDEQVDQDIILDRFGLPGHVREWSMQNVLVFFESLDLSEYKSAISRFK